ncbi:MAG: hypothetical protein AAGA46_03435 [Cyanobacteria bacterium P01_F01_bin.13]
MANPPETLTEETITRLIDQRVQKAIAEHERRFSWYGLPLILGVVGVVCWWG